MAEQLFSSPNVFTCWFSSVNLPLKISSSSCERLASNLQIQQVASHFVYKKHLVKPLVR
jgi:hypothetical protein